MCYILITPVRNEEKNLPCIAKCIDYQTKKPKIWLIVDDKSTDGTSSVIKDLTQNFDYIYSINSNHPGSYGHLSFASSVKLGYEYAKEMCNNYGIRYDFVGKVDADIALKKDYFEKLLETIKRDSTIGIVSGVHYVINDDYVDSIEKKFEAIREWKNIKRIYYILDAMADERLYNKNFLENVGGFPISYSPDTVLSAKAKIKGYKAIEIQDVGFFEFRKADSNFIWRRNKNDGFGYYYLDYPLSLVILNTLYNMTKKPYYPGLACSFGYFTHLIQKKGKIEDHEIRDYFRITRKREIADYALKSFENNKLLSKVLKVTR